MDGVLLVSWFSWFIQPRIPDCSGQACGISTAPYERDLRNNRHGEITPTKIRFLYDIMKFIFV